MPLPSGTIHPLILGGGLPDIEPDCACPAPVQTVHPLPPPGSVFERVPDLHTHTLNDDWTLFYNPLAGGAPLVLNSAAQERLEQFAQPHFLDDSIDMQLAQVQLIRSKGSANRTPASKISTLVAWVHVTNACNLECPYCYVRKSGAKMTPLVGMAAIDGIIATAMRHGFSTVKLKYAGGEAALHYKLVQQLHAYAKEQTTRHGLALQAVVLSNGTVMPPAFVAWLAATGVKLMLSIDGVGAEHDQQRPWKGRGNGAFAALERNLTERLLPAGIRPDICITVTGRNAATIDTTVEWMLQYDLPFRLNFYRENDVAANRADLQFEEDQIIMGLQKAYTLIEQYLPLRPMLSGLLDYMQAQSHTHTCGVGQSYLVITHDGKVAQCHMLLEQAQPFNSKDDLIELVAAGDIHNLSVDEKEGCRSCRWRYQCTGGCPITTFRATGRFDIKSPNCRIYQTLFPEALRLEGLRILKVHQAFG